MHHSPVRSLYRIVGLAAVLILVAAACGDNDSDGSVSNDSVSNGTSNGGGQAVTETSVDDGAADDELASTETPPAAEAGSTVTLLTHDSFALSDETLEAFTASTGIKVEVLQVGDAGQLVSQAVLTAEDPLGDALFGIDNTFLQRGLDADIFQPYSSPNLADVSTTFQLDPQHRVTPVDFGDVCLNYWIDAFTGEDSPPAPDSLDDLIDPAYADMLVVQNPETSSPGLAFMLATINRYGDGWEDYWTDLRANGVAVTSGWEDAYYGQFVAGGGDRPIVVSYASSPPAEVIYADPPVDAPPTAVVTDSCYRQIEFVGVLAGADNPLGAQALIDFMLTAQYQNDVPLNMFVFPVASSAVLPEVFAEHAQIAADPLMLEPAEVEAGRDTWTDRWVEVVLR